MPKSEIPERAIEFIKKFEVFYADAYPDPRTKGKPITIGYGSTRKLDGSEWKLGDRITEAEADELLRQQLPTKYLPPLKKIPHWEDLNENQRVALISFAYNVGPYFYNGYNFDTISERLLNQDFTNIEEVFSLYCDKGTDVEDGLRRRRKAEARLFMKPMDTLVSGKFELNIILHTSLKRSEGSASVLPDSHKRVVRPGERYAIASYQDDKNHWLIQLIEGLTAQDGSGPYTQWRVFKEHCNVELVPEVEPVNNELPPSSSPVHSKQTPVSSVDLSNQDVQKILIDLGLLDPPADGRWGKQSKASLQDFQRFVQLPPTGELTAETKEALLRAKPFIKLDNSYPSRIVKFMQQRGYFVAAGNRRFNILMIEGIDPDSGKLVPDRPNEFCDARVLLEIPFSGIPRIVGAWQATCKAGYHYCDFPMNPKGTARCDRKQFKAWQLGVHGISNPHEALLQVRPITIKRYKGRRNYYSETNSIPDEGVFQINFHWGYNYPKDDIEYASAGCLVGRTTEGHKNCMRIIKSDRRFETNNDYIFYITIIAGKDIQS
jgi:GH24 family phage-related lysozyme (muramidase)